MTRPSSLSDEMLATTSARSGGGQSLIPSPQSPAPAAQSPVPAAQSPVPDTQSPVPTSERDRDVLRSFAKRIDPSDAGAHNNLGVLYYNKGLLGESVAAFSRALELDAKMQVAQRNIEIAY